MSYNSAAPFELTRKNVYNMYEELLGREHNNLDSTKSGTLHDVCIRTMPDMNKTMALTTTIGRDCIARYRTKLHGKYSQRI